MREHSPSVERPLAGRLIVVTGASDGVGKAATRAFARDGAEVVMIGRNEAKTVAAARAIMSETGSRTVYWQIADLSEQDSIRELATRLRATYQKVDVLANNAGAMFFDRALTRDGLERTFALNHISYALLTALLLPCLSAAATPGKPARVISVASRAHRDARPDLDDLQGALRFGAWRAYANSKLFNIWFTRSLAQRVDATRLSVQSLHPGVVKTRFATNNGRLGRVFRRFMDLNSITPEKGADTLVWLASAPEALEHQGGYWVRRTLTEPSKFARDDARRERFWRQTSTLLQLDLDAAVRDAFPSHAT